MDHANCHRASPAEIEKTDFWCYVTVLNRQHLTAYFRHEVAYARRNRICWISANFAFSAASASARFRSSNCFMRAVNKSSRELMVSQSTMHHDSIVNCTGSKQSLPYNNSKAEYPVERHTDTRSAHNVSGIY